MIKSIKVISTEFDSIKRRVVKFLGLGISDIQTSIEVGPCNIDSNPIKDMVAIYAETSVRGDTYIIGYINKQQMADSGELRLYSTDSAGALKAYAWLKKNGNLELNGSADNAVRYSPLNTSMNTLSTDINAQLAAIATAITAVGGAYVPVAISIDISTSKINNIKTS